MLIPQHIAIIMDGNRRWARKHKLAILKGHEFASKNTIEKIITQGIKRKIKYLTFWVFSTENWNRNKKEVEGLLHIFRWGLKEKVKSFIKNGVKVKIIGDLSKFPEDIQEGVKEMVDKTREGKNITVVWAINYGGRDEIVRAVYKLHENVQCKMYNLQLNKDTLSSNLDTAGIPDPDLIIRTGGEKRLSGFLLWQSEYSELYFTDTLWPDFNETDLDLAISDYSLRLRRFGR